MDLSGQICVFLWMDLEGKVNGFEDGSCEWFELCDRLKKINR